MMNHTRLSQLVDRAMANALTDEEQLELQELLADETNQEAINRVLGEKWEVFEASQPVFSKAAGGAMLQRILGDPKPADQQAKATVNRKRLWWTIGVAAAMLMAALFFIDRYTCDHAVEELSIAQAVKRYDIQPGGDKATLRLASGEELVLNEREEGLLAEEEGVKVFLLADRRIRYVVQDGHAVTAAYHTIWVPKGGHYYVELGDGTNVHLNAGSRLRIPIAFTSSARKVELTGEGFFEVAHETNRPFSVITQQQEVQVLGTAFNVCAYPRLAHVKTTLVEGRVNVVGTDHHVVSLKPGEVAVSKASQAGIEVQQGDVDKDLAWHNGYFVFVNEPITDIMERVGQWYNVAVTYEGDMGGIALGGVFRRSKSIAQLLESFRATGLVDFHIAGRRITVMRK